ncbi:2'-5' RNA ligase [Burkholderia diffusa]|uniref:2'-5' RNA ligase family protein n=1 Tax=Burkholderia diffusa TaxID=488732 RepID=UPI00075D5794|nr:2'-5' RNA ligase family protein [Burkholderia diffusa]KUZ18274.1 2'-5' RNA ligase [Burkholderia diffusa]KVC10373.1 2'-5' RNA ligase [Burkholderia diffusa]
MIQLTLPGFDSRPPAAEHRFFFATMPDAETATRLAGIARQLHGGKPPKSAVLRAERLHVTLYPLGDFAYVPGATLARACAAAGRIDAPPLRVTFDEVVSFNGRPGHCPLVLTGSAGLHALIAFQQRLRVALGEAGLRVSSTRFTPHVTLLYGERRLGRYTIEPISWTMFDFVLIHSWLGRTHYDVIGHWPLTARSPAG